MLRPLLLLLLILLLLLLLLKQLVVLHLQAKLRELRQQLEEKTEQLSETREELEKVQTVSSRWVGEARAGLQVVLLRPAILRRTLSVLLSYVRHHNPTELIKNKVTPLV